MSKQRSGDCMNVLRKLTDSVVHPTYRGKFALSLLNCPWWGCGQGNVTMPWPLPHVLWNVHEAPTEIFLWCFLTDIWVLDSNRQKSFHSRMKLENLHIVMTPDLRQTDIVWDWCSQRAFLDGNWWWTKGRQTKRVGKELDKLLNC